MTPNDLPIAYYRSERGGQLPLPIRGRREQRQLLELYIAHDRPVKEIVALFGITSHQFYRALPILGCRPRSEMPGTSTKRRLRRVS